MAEQDSFLIHACPAAGKTQMAGYIAANLLGKAPENPTLPNSPSTKKAIDFVLVIVPTTGIKRSFMEKFSPNFGIELTVTLKTQAGGPPPRSFDGAVITYQQLVQGDIPAIARIWKETYNVNLMTIFDEVHHASQANRWGVAANRLAEVSAFNLNLTGTPFRTDEQEIQFINYDDRHQAIPDFSYTYPEALKDGICRRIYIQHDDGVAEYTFDQMKEEVRITESTKENQAKVSATVWNHNSEFLRNVIIKAQTQLEVYEAEGRGYTPACLVICRVGKSGQEDKPLQAVARKIRDITGERVETVSYDDPMADDKIEAFRDDPNCKWICAVRKISEGVDIPRLRVMIMATATNSELLFRQMVGRIIRTKDFRSREHSTLFMAKFQDMEDFATRLEEEAQLGLKDDDGGGGGTPPTGDDPEDGDEDDVSPDFIIHDSSYEEAGGWFHGERFSPNELQHAELVRANDNRLGTFTADQLALIIRTSEKVKDIPVVVSEEPLHSRKKQLRKKLGKRVLQLNFRLNPMATKDDFSALWKRIHQIFGVKSIDDLMDNHDIEKMKQVQQWVDAQFLEINSKVHDEA